MFVSNLNDEEEEKEGLFKILFWFCSFKKHIEHLLDEINAARNILLFPKKRLIPELQAQKNMVSNRNRAILFVT